MCSRLAESQLELTHQSASLLLVVTRRIKMPVQRNRHVILWEDQCMFGAKSVEVNLQILF